MGRTTQIKDTVTMRIGKKHNNELDGLRSLLGDLVEVSTGEFVGAFEEQIEELNTWQARIAAIGQVKAGKSSTLNALIGDIGFLPSDVNPWTSVVTSMRINVPGDPECGARFDFFDEQSWDRIINGDPHIRDAAKQNLPGFDAELLRDQTEDMRRNAERRLGKYYHSLLGSKHEYEMLSPELLQRYVCAGPGADTGLERESLGRYASITRAANLFMRSEEFAVPTVIMDTPGVNDPYLVRDEFTCQSLDQSDIFLMTLSAHQTLTEVDIALIRMVALQGDKDIIIYVNRIDELENYPKRIDRIVKDLSIRLAEAIPENEFSIVFGSARWAELAISQDTAPDEIQEVLSDQNFEVFLERHRGLIPVSDREKLLVASGMADVKEAISNAISKGSGARFIERLKADAHAQVASYKTVSERQRIQLVEQIESYGSGRISEYKETIEDELQAFEEVDVALVNRLALVDEELDAVINDTWVAIQQEMDHETGRFIRDQSTYVETIINGNAAADEEMSIELLPLRVSMEKCVAAHYDRARGVVDQILDEALADVIEITKPVTEGIGERISMDMLPGETVAVTFTTSRKMLSLNLVSKRGWAFWKKKQGVDLTKTLEALKKVTSAEVYPATSKMIEAFTDTMSRRVLAGKHRLNLIKGIVEQALSDRRERMHSDHAILNGQASEAIRSKTINRLQNDIEVIDNRLQVIAAKESVLTAEVMSAAA